MAWQYMAFELVAHISGITFSTLCPVPAMIKNPQPGPYAAFGGVALSARDGRLVLRSNGPDFVRVYDFKSRDLVSKFAPPGNPDGPSWCTVATGKGLVAVTTSEGGRQVRVYDGNTVKHTLTEPSPGDHLFGRCVDTDGQFVVVGAPYFSKNLGAAYIFDLKDPQKPITLKDPKAEGSLFGQAVGIDGGLVAVAAPLAMVKSGNAELPAGAVYLFDLKGKLVRKIENPAPMDNTLFGSWWRDFGVPLTLRSGILALGAPRQTVNNVQVAGAVYVYDPPTASTPTVLTHPSLVDSLFFGVSVAVGDDLIAVGSWDRKYDPALGYHAGAVALFSRPAGNFVCLAGNPSSDEWNAFGTSRVVADEDRYAVGAGRESVDGVIQAGTVYVYDAEPRYQYTVPEAVPIVPPGFPQWDRPIKRTQPTRARRTGSPAARRRKPR